VTVITVPQAFNEDELYVDLEPIWGHPLFLKCEGFNFAGSIKLKPAAEMVEAAEQDGTLKPGSILIESSSGNLGVALSMIAASKGYRFLCVTDSRCNLSTRRLMEALGARSTSSPNRTRSAVSSARGSTTCARRSPPTTGTCG
jgi:cysteine synthase A